MKRAIISILLAAALMPFFGYSSVIEPGRAEIFGQKNNFLLKGTIEGQTKGYLKLSYLSANGKQVQDSCAITNGTFEFKGELTEPVMAYFSGALKSRDYNDPNFGTFYLEPGVLTLSVTAGDFKNLKLTGSRTQDEMSALADTETPVKKELEPLSKAYDIANNNYIQAMREKKPEAELNTLKDKAVSIKDQMEPYYEKIGMIDMEFIKSHPSSYHAAYLLQYKVASMPLDSSVKYYRRLPETIKQGRYGKGIAEEIKSLQAGSPGSKATLFSAKDINGEQLDLTSFAGKKYILLDFWASWCVPCRKGNPHLLSLYSKYKDKGLEIVGVSDDDSKPEAWKKAVQQDGIGVWKHVLRGLKQTATGFDKSADLSAPFGIHTLPTKILIDKNGMIIGRYGGGGEDDEAMNKKLDQLFGT